MSGNKKGDRRDEVVQHSGGRSAMKNNALLLKEGMELFSSVPPGHGSKGPSLRRNGMLSVLEAHARRIQEGAQIA